MPAGEGGVGLNAALWTPALICSCCADRCRRREEGLLRFSNAEEALELLSAAAQRGHDPLALHALAYLPTCRQATRGEPGWRCRDAQWGLHGEAGPSKVRQEAPAFSGLCVLRCGGGGGPHPLSSTCVQQQVFPDVPPNHRFLTALLHDAVRGGSMRIVAGMLKVGTGRRRRVVAGGTSSSRRAGML